MPEDAEASYQSQFPETVSLSNSTFAKGAVALGILTAGSIFALKYLPGPSPEPKPAKHIVSNYETISEEDQKKIEQRSSQFRGSLEAALLEYKHWFANEEVAQAAHNWLGMKMSIDEDYRKNLYANVRIDIEKMDASDRPGDAFVTPRGIQKFIEADAEGLKKKFPDKFSDFPTPKIVERALKYEPPKADK